MIAFLTPWLLVGAGGAVGAMLRHGVNQLCLHVLGAGFPWGTMLVNITGSLIMGLLVGAFALWGETAQELRLFLTVGVLGGFTTFSAFSLDAVLLFEKGQIIEACFYVLGSVVLSLAALCAGLMLIRMLPL